MRHHLTQSDTGQMAAAAIEKGDFHYFQQPVRLVLGKSVIGGDAKADLFDGITSNPARFTRPPGYSAPRLHGPTIRLGGPWAFYRDFDPAHGLTAIPGLLSAPEVAVDAGARLHIPILLENPDGAPVEIAVSAAAPAGWKVVRGPARYPVPAHGEYPASVVIEVPANAAAEWHEVRIQSTGAHGAVIGDIRVRVHIEPGALPQ